MILAIEVTAVFISHPVILSNKLQTCQKKRFFLFWGKFQFFEVVKNLYSFAPPDYVLIHRTVKICVPKVIFDNLFKLTILTHLIHISINLALSAMAVQSVFCVSYQLVNKKENESTTSERPWSLKWNEMIVEIQFPL